jgi:hypothetical protein
MEFWHTHYDPYGPPRKVAGTLLDCDQWMSHDVSRSGIHADYPYAPELVPSKSTGMDPAAERSLMEHITATTDMSRPLGITDVSGPQDDDGNGRGALRYLVRVSARTPHGAWGVITFGLYDTGWNRVPENPHPGYPHWSSFCENCGH